MLRIQLDFIFAIPIIILKKNIPHKQFFSKGLLVDNGRWEQRLITQHSRHLSSTIEKLALD